MDGITRNDKVRGIMLFGSVKRGMYRKENDPDILIAVRGKAMDVIEEVEETIDRVEGLKDPFDSKWILSQDQAVRGGRERSENVPTDLLEYRGGWGHTLRTPGNFDRLH